MSIEINLNKFDRGYLYPIVLTFKAGFATILYLKNMPKEFDIRSPISYIRLEGELATNAQSDTDGHIPADDFQETGRKWVDLPVDPITEADLLALPLDKRTETLKNRAFDYYKHWLREDAPQLQKESRTDAIRLGCYLHDISIRNRLTQAESHARTRYEAEKQRIRTQVRSKPAQEKAIQQAYRDIVEPAKIKTVQETTLRDSMLDAFIQDFLLDNSGHQRLLDAASDLAVHTTGFDHSHVQALVEQAGKRISKLNSTEHAAFFGYKQTADSLITLPDTNRLINLIKSAHMDCPDGTLEASLKNASYQLLEFYWRHLDKLQPDEAHPTAAFVYDYALAASLDTSQAYFLNASSWLLRKINGKQNLLADELVQIGLESRNETRIFDRLMRQIFNSPEFSGLEFNNFLIGYNPQVFPLRQAQTQGKYIIGRNYDRFSSLNSLFAFWNSLGLSGFWEQTVFPKLQKALLEGHQVPELRLIQLVQESEEDVGLETYTAIWKKSLFNAHPQILFLDDRISRMMTKKQYRERISRAVGIPTIEVTAESVARDLESLTPDRFTTEQKMVYQTNMLLQLFSENQSPEDIDDSISLHGENTLLISQIRDSNRWFVATNGDRFTSIQNPDLETRNIHSVTFYPDPRVAGYRINIISNIQDSQRRSYETTILMDRNGNLYYENATPIPTSEWVKLPIQNLLLNYLEYITSGRAGTTGAVEPKLADSQSAEAIERQELERKRHQWRNMVSTPKNRITLHSPQAQAHREFVKTVYGIDIYRENLRRWRNRSLKAPKMLDLEQPQIMLLQAWESGELLASLRDPMSAESEDIFEILTFVQGIENPHAPPYEHTYIPVEKNG
jgi:hypothetical protein